MIDALVPPSLGPLVDDIISRAASRPGDRAFLVAVAGGVAVGKTTFAARLAEALMEGSAQLAVSVVSADGFLKANGQLIAEGLLARKGYPESYDASAIADFRDAVSSGAPQLRVLLYSHAAYDVAGEARFDKPDILVVEGLLALSFAPDYGVYLDAESGLMEAWYVARFLAFERHRAPRLADQWARVEAAGGRPADLAREIWRAVNLPLLNGHIEPQRALADAVVVKGADHGLIEVRRAKPG